jgi:hypothetical protein
MAILGRHKLDSTGYEGICIMDEEASKIYDLTRPNGLALNTLEFHEGVHENLLESWRESNISIVKRRFRLLARAMERFVATQYDLTRLRQLNFHMKTARTEQEMQEWLARAIDEDKKMYEEALQDFRDTATIIGEQRFHWIAGQVRRFAETLHNPLRLQQFIIHLSTASTEQEVQQWMKQAIEVQKDELLQNIREPEYPQE